MHRHVGYVRLGVEPGGQQFELRGWDLPALNAVEKMLEQRGRKILPSDLGTARASGPVEAASRTLPEAARFRGIGGRRELFREQTELFGAQPIDLAFERSEFGRLPRHLMLK